MSDEKKPKDKEKKTKDKPADDAGDGEARKPTAAVWLILCGGLACIVCLVWACALVTRFITNPMSQPSLLLMALLALGFQIGFTLCACGLATIGKQAVYVYLPLSLVCALLLGAASGVIGYLASSGADVAYMKPKTVEYGWELERETSGLRECSVTYQQTATMGGQSMRARMTVTVPRRRTGPMSTEAWNAHMERVGQEPRNMGGVERTNRETKRVTISGQRTLKVVDTLKGGRGPNIMQARYWWYSPKLDRLLTCVAVADEMSKWKLDAVEKMLESIPIE